MADRPSQKLTNQQKLDFLIDAILIGGDSMDGTNSLQFQIKQSPIDALWNAQIDWGEYQTSAYQQLAYNAQALARANAALANQQAQLNAQNSLLQQLVSQLGQGVPVVIDYDRIAADIKANMPEFELPSFEIIPKPKELTNG
ncbi:hypothetical protein ACIPY0_12175 [Paenarthrobacter nicotinovorans]|uniref:hypothetical protein n=1 Tax=Paenarthrobacter nicotinovorans TaxID=29320 RepID=UPI00381C1B61